MPTFDFLQLSALQPHEELCAQGKVVRADNSMTHIFYVSHEWTSLRHPDHSNSQLYSFQSILQRMLRGTLPKTAPTFSDALRLPSNVSVTSAEWQGIIQDSFVWIDFISVSSSSAAAAAASRPPIARRRRVERPPGRMRPPLTAWNVHFTASCRVLDRCHKRTVVRVGRSLRL